MGVGSVLGKVCLVSLGGEGGYLRAHAYVILEHSIHKILPPEYETFECCIEYRFILYICIICQNSWNIYLFKILNWDIVYCIIVCAYTMEK